MVLDAGERVEESEEERGVSGISWLANEGMRGGERGWIAAGGLGGSRTGPHEGGEGSLGLTKEAGPNSKGVGSDKYPEFETKGGETPVVRGPQREKKGWDREGI